MAPGTVSLVFCLRIYVAPGSVSLGLCLEICMPWVLLVQFCVQGYVFFVAVSLILCLGIFVAPFTVGLVFCLWPLVLLVEVLCLGICVPLATV